MHPDSQGAEPNAETHRAPADLELHRVHKTFGRTVAVDHLDLRLTRGELVALLGPSGCGKTTTLRIVAGFERPDSGEVWMGGKPATRLPPHRRNIGIVFQNYALFPHMTVGDNVAYGLRRRRVPESEIRLRVDDTLAMVDRNGLASRYPRELSGGQQQRVAVARAIVIRPAILLFDEPLSNLDARLRQVMRGELRSLQRRLGITALFVTHDQDEALTMADRIAVMNAGVIEQIGTAEQVYRWPATRFVAGFVGECNFLDAIVQGVEGRFGCFSIGPVVVRVGFAGGAVASGTVGSVALRPEDISIVDSHGEPPPQSNVAEARTLDCVYFGSKYHYKVSLTDGPDLLVCRQRDARAPLAPGTHVRIVWPWDCGVFFTGKS
jgi:putative spermidine/putrescine transport system ATP-binding protein